MLLDADGSGEFIVTGLLPRQLSVHIHNYLPWNYPPPKHLVELLGPLSRHMKARPEVVGLFGLASCDVEIDQATHCILCRWVVHA